VQTLVCSTLEVKQKRPHTGVCPSKGSSLNRNNSRAAAAPRGSKVSHEYTGICDLRRNVLAEFMDDVGNFIGPSSVRNAVLVYFPRSFSSRSSVLFKS
jgi:hypothetical protein